LAWLIAVATIPAVIAGLLLNDFIEEHVREAGTVAVLLVIGAAILWLADRWGPRARKLSGLTFPGALGVGVAQAGGLIPGVSRSGIWTSAALFAGLDREDAARFSFLMATPVTLGAVLFEGLKLVRGEVVGVQVAPMVAGVVAAFLSGVFAIAILLRYV